MTSTNNTRMIVGRLTKEEYEDAISIGGYLFVDTKDIPTLTGKLILDGIKYNKDLKRIIENKTELSDVKDPKVRMHILSFIEKQKQDMQFMLNFLAGNIKDDETMDILVNTAEELDLDLEQAKRQANSEIANRIEYIQSPDTKKGKCLQWMIQLFSKKQEMPANVVIAMGEGIGFNKAMINRCKRELGITSKKREGGKYWWTYTQLMEVPQVKMEYCD